MVCWGFYPHKNKIQDNGIEGYVLSVPDLISISTQLQGKPLTYEHKGIALATKDLSDEKIRSSFEVIRSLNRTSQSSSVRAPIGVVTGAWQGYDGRWMCSWRINKTLFPRLCAMINAGSLRGISLSHIQIQSNKLVALEISMCIQPARPGCYVVAGPFDSSNECLQYKTKSRKPSYAKPSAMSSTTETASELNMETVLQGMQPEHRSLISAAFADMDKKLKSPTKTTVI